MRERISVEEAQKLERRARHKEILLRLERLDTGDLQLKLVALMDKAVESLMKLQVQIDELKLKTGEPLQVSPQVTIDNSAVAGTLEKALQAMEARMQHELSRLQAKEQAQSMIIEFTRSETGYIQSPIIVKPQ